MRFLGGERAEGEGGKGKEAMEPLSALWFPESSLGSREMGAQDHLLTMERTRGPESRMQEGWVLLDSRWHRASEGEGESENAPKY